MARGVGLRGRLQALQCAWPDLPVRLRQRKELSDQGDKAQTAASTLAQQLQALKADPPPPAPPAPGLDVAPDADPNAESPPEETHAACAAALQAAQIALNQALSERAALQQQQKQDEQCRQTHARQQALIEARRQAAQRWRALNQLIGSASGDAFRR